VHDHKFLACGPVHLKDDSGRELEWLQVGLQPAAACVSLYVTCEQRGEYLAKSHARKLGKVSDGKAASALNGLKTSILKFWLNSQPKPPPRPPARSA